MKTKILVVAGVMSLVGAGCTHRERTADNREVVEDVDLVTADAADDADDVVIEKDVVTTAQYEANNTGRNKVDAENSTLTPIDQSNDASDIKITADIRKAIVADDSLSTDAQNVKIITIDRNVTLRGPVKSEAERQAVVRKAEAVAGKARVTNLLTVNVH